MSKMAFGMLISSLLFSGCSIIKSSVQPLDRPPERIVEGLAQSSVDKIYGYPVAVGMNEDGKEYIEQIQFVDGIPWGWKIGRVAMHCLFDSCSFSLWEFIGFPFELINSNYPEYIYFVVYDDGNNVIRAIPQDSPEGRQISALPWIAPRQETQVKNRKPTVKRFTLEERIAASQKTVVKKVGSDLSKQKTALPVSKEVKTIQTEKTKSSATLEAMLNDGLITREEYERMRK